MPTQEERVTTLERDFTNFTKETAKQNRRTDENLTILLGLVQTQGLEFKRVNTRLDTMDERLDKMDGRLETLEHDVRDIKGLLAQLLERLSK